MADVTSVLGSISQKFLECPICHGRYQQPKILDCLHTFCQECLVTLQQFSSEHRSRSFIQCPVCNQKSKLPEQGIGKLKTNFHLVGLIEEISVHEQVAQSEQNKKGHICGCCDEEEAVSKCINCIQNLCLKCQIVPQHVAAILAKHTEASLDDLSFGKIAHRFRKQREAAECPLHSGEEKKFCETCEELVCQHCPCDCEKSESGSTCHLKIDLKSAASDGRKLFREMLEKLQITLSEFKSTLDAVKKKRPECGGYLDGVKKQVQEHASKVHAEVSAEESHLVFQLSKIRRNQQETLIKRGTAIESAIEKMSTTKEVADAFCETSEDQDFLAVFPLIRQALEAHLSRKTSDIHKGLPLWDFRKREGKCEIGTLVKTGMNTFLPHELHDQAFSGLFII
ncbi:E3 ubiquitin-protein ligase TRIM56-like [Acanthaster planci]|uniref:E3 ubiquitin-protein ligase TRIM56-like n=1 Tax=Acanthaster planci TaxID=133434 RepID=A0A8B7Y4R7_ACAPL|nr:E3 ubiquitin-protein ligase TRIM56-like [Acanthaster planci]